MQALPIVSAGLGIYSAIKGAQQQGNANRINAAQLQQLQAQQQAQNQIRQQALGRLMQAPTGAVGNPFSSAYGKVG